MLVFPQLSTGALSQFPVQKRRTLRTVMNRAADGSLVKLADPGGATTEWTLSYTTLTDDELAILAQFYADAEGTLNGFTFLDPTANLLAWSDHLDHAVWQRDPLLSVTGGISDPAGRSQAWRLSNSGAGAQTIAQSLSAPSGYRYSLSTYVRAPSPLRVVLLLGNDRFERPVTAEWLRIAATASCEARFGLEIPAGSELDLYGIQAEPQVTPSGYRASTTGGVYEDARLREDHLQVTTTDVNQHSCTVNIIHAKHI